MKWVIVALGIVLIGGFKMCAQDSLAQNQRSGGDHLNVVATKQGLRFGVLGNKPTSPAPTLLIFSSTFKATLTDPTYIETGLILAKHGYLSVSMDLPCPDYATQLSDWRRLIEKGSNFVPEFVGQVSA